MSGARPKLTRETVDCLLTGIRAGMPYRLAAEAAGISETTFYAWQRGVFPRGADKELKSQFSKELMRARAEAALKLLLIIQRAAHTDWRAAAWILERRFPEDFGKQVFEHTGKDGGPIAHDVTSRAIVRELPDDVIERLAGLHDEQHAALTS